MASSISKVYNMKNNIILFSLLISIVSCKEVFEEDISTKAVEIILPANNYTTPNRLINFRWNELEGASSYNIQIVSPSFSNIQSFTIDSNITNNQVTFNLSPGNYEWKLKAQNFNHETAYSAPFKLTIDTSSDLSNQQVILNNPSSSYKTNSTNFLFSWQAIAEANDYDFIIKNGNDFNSGSIYESHYDIIINQQQINNIPEGLYSWGVRAKNNIPSLTNYTTFSLSIDTTKSPQPTITSPSNNSSFSDSTLISFSVNIPPDVGSNQTNRKTVTEFYSDSIVTLFDTVQSTINSFQYQFLNSGDYYFRSYLVDEASNQSDYTSVYKVTITP